MSELESEIRDIRFVFVSKNIQVRICIHLKYDKKRYSNLISYEPDLFLSLVSGF